jgi:hypothetical protein
MDSIQVLAWKASIIGIYFVVRNATGATQVRQNLSQYGQLYRFGQGWQAVERLLE